jgi:heterodisulfide reductase subunit A-like polyferredoxin
MSRLPRREHGTPGAPGYNPALDATHPKYADPCADCGCGVACHWDDLTVSAPDPRTTRTQCSVCPSCKGYRHQEVPANG